MVCSYAKNESYLKYIKYMFGVLVCCFPSLSCICTDMNKYNGKYWIKKERARRWLAREIKDKSL